MPDYSTSIAYPNGNYRLNLKARTTQVTGGTLVETYVDVQMITNPGTPAFGSGASASFTVPGGRDGSVSGALVPTESQTGVVYDFSVVNPEIFWNYRNKYVASSYGTSTTISATVASNSGSTFFTSRTVSLNVPLFASFTVTYNSAGGSSTPATQTVDAGTLFTTASAPSRSGYTFAYWLGSDGLIYDDGLSYTMPSANITLTAVWLGNPTIGSTSSTANSVTFNWSAPASSATGFQVRLGTGTWTDTTGTSYTFSGLTAGTSYSVSVRSRLGTTSYTSTSTSTSISTLAPASWTISQNTTLTNAKVGIPYSYSTGSLINNELSVTLYSGELPLGLSINTAGVISGTPQQKASRNQAAEGLGFIDQYKFRLSAQGQVGTNPAVSPELTINIVFPGRRFTSAGQWTPLSIARRWDAANGQWVPIQDSTRYTNNSGGITDITTS